MHMYVYIYIYICLYHIYIYIYMYIHTYVSTHVYMLLSNPGLWERSLARSAFLLRPELIGLRFEARSYL